MPDFRALPFDTNAMLAALRRFVECESPSYDAAAVSRMAALAAAEMAAMGASVERIAGLGGFGDCVRARFVQPTHGDSGILVIGHLDTVHPLGTLHELPWRRADGLCYGPGILDMKGGIVIALAAINALGQAGIGTSLPVTMLFNSDEEVGSPSTRPLIEAEASRHRYVLIPEPARRSGAVVVGRHAVARYKLVTRGRPSHAGLRLNEGRSAIQEMAHQVIAIDRLSEPDCTFSTGVIHGGQWVNCVARQCEAELLSVSTSETALERGRRTLQGLRPTAPGTEVEVVPGVVRPFWHAASHDRALFEKASRIAADLGFDLAGEASGGGSDGNFTGALGVPTLDGLGPRGDALHTLEEHIVVESLAERGRLLAGLFASLD
ncbi:MAG TPA: M20/M25/M40 family metallo-hydrolase [Rhizomicrobium sp.]|nr:M20/M25/M40 family metallo-hydrolase [Rhizomicrobium sp.]